jgi:hypothetical protein
MLDGMKQVLLVATLVLASAACKQEVAASVVCKALDGPSAECTVTQTKGTAEFETCWEFKITCENNATLEAAKTCATVKDGNTVTAKTPPEKMKMTGTCDKVKTAVVGNMTINGEAAK